MVTLKRYVNIKGKNCISVSGVDFGAPVEIIKETEKGLLCKCGGCRAWCGRGDLKYYNPEFIIFKKIKNDEVEECFGPNFEYNRKSKKEVFKEACKKLESLDKEKK